MLVSKVEKEDFSNSAATESILTGKLVTNPNRPTRTNTSLDLFT